MYVLIRRYMHQHIHTWTNGIIHPWTRTCIHTQTHTHTHTQYVYHFLHRVSICLDAQIRRAVHYLRYTYFHANIQQKKTPCHMLKWYSKRSVCMWKCCVRCYMRKREARYDMLACAKMHKFGKTAQCAWNNNIRFWCCFLTITKTVLHDGNNIHVLHHFCIRGHGPHLPVCCVAASMSGLVSMSGKTSKAS
jgi:hypothetical protein